MEKRPQVFPTQEQRQMATAQIDAKKMEAYEREKAQVTGEVYNNSFAPDNNVNLGYNYLNQNDAIEMMKQRTQQQMNAFKDNGKIQYPDLAEKPANNFYAQDSNYDKNEDQIRQRDAALEKNRQQIENYQRMANAASQNRNNPGMPGAQQPLYPQQNQQDMGGYNYQPPVTPPPTPPVNNGFMGQNFGSNPSNINPYMIELSQPNYNCPFDVIPLPSGGKTYNIKKAGIRVGYMTTADENILTSPNLLESGEFLEILFNRKILESGLRYKDLLVGDRNAIMIWLRATAYGEMYPVTLLDENNVPFDTEINLNDLKMKKLEVDPDSEGLFSFFFPLCKATIKFKLLTMGDVEDIERMVEADKANNIPVNNSNTYTFERMIVEVNGSRDRNMIREFANSIRIKDAKEFSSYLDKLECGVDMTITVRTPGGGSVESFLPLNFNFFWPNSGL
jgi:hypothetical protein